MTRRILFYVSAIFFSVEGFSQNPSKVGLKFSGYLQAQFISTQQNDKSHANEFMLRRGRLKADFFSLYKDSTPKVQFVFQMNATESGIEIKDLYATLFENKFKIFSLTAGLFVVPFGYEITYSSSSRESPERGRMAQQLIKGERDLGAMISLKKSPAISFEAGIFNGGNSSVLTEFDNYKDIIARVSTNHNFLKNRFSLNAGLSAFYGGFKQNTIYINRYTDNSLITDSSLNNIGKKLPRHYYAGDLQISYNWIAGKSEARTEYWFGTQSSNQSSFSTPYKLLNEPSFIRDFRGAVFYLLHKYKRHEFGIKYDFLDPNIKVKGASVRNAGDLKFSTFGVGYIYDINENAKVTAWYEMPKNETSNLNGFNSDLKDNVFTFRLQVKF